jgi:hypothetical protein
MARSDLADEELGVVDLSADAEIEADGNIFQVLACQARTRTTSELRLTAFGGLVNAILLVPHPALSWLAAGFAATGAYGLWGLLDAAARRRLSTDESPRATIKQLIGLRDLTAILGTGAALWAVLAFMAATFSNWHH